MITFLVVGADQGPTRRLDSRKGGAKSTCGVFKSTLTPAGSEMVARKLQQQREGGSREEAAEGYDEAGLILLGHT
jgi:hypothetical protein